MTDAHSQLFCVKKSYFHQGAFAILLPMRTIAFIGYGFMGRIHAACRQHIRGVLVSAFVASADIAVCAAAFEECSFTASFDGTAQRYLLAAPKDVSRKMRADAADEAAHDRR